MCHFGQNPPVKYMEAWKKGLLAEIECRLAMFVPCVVAL